MIDKITYLETDRLEDPRGGFMRVLDTGWGVPPILQVSIADNLSARTLRGMHSMTRSQQEFKIVTCIQGSISDFVVDLRPESSDYLVVQNYSLNENNPGTLLIPPGCAHGYITLEPNSRVMYSMSALYNPAAEVGFLWNDAQLGIEWPFEPAVISERDSSFAPLEGKPVL